ncbi:LAMI_0G09648g1_1 [Lachancea mirantina]|uniref:LAMI_0G09648g1_1 n=1 Tax=Lachancea mirantina TaxID=1230905 RepID=A0A1G4KAG1_9SACH|nr:LAMI_0G09648g1_1 [Lachancea mirantina]
MDVEPKGALREARADPSVQDAQRSALFAQRLKEIIRAPRIVFRRRAGPETRISRSNATAVMYLGTCAELHPRTVETGRQDVTGVWAELEISQKKDVVNKCGALSFSLRGARPPSGAMPRTGKEKPCVRGAWVFELVATRFFLAQRHARGQRQNEKERAPCQARVSLGFGVGVDHVVAVLCACA